MSGQEEHYLQWLIENEANTAHEDALEQANHGQEDIFGMSGQEKHYLQWLIENEAAG